MADIQEVMVTQESQLKECLAHLEGCSHFGFDTEFVGEDTYHPRLCLVQVATDDVLYLIDPLAVGSLDGFWKLVVDPGRLVVVHAGREEIRLCQLWAGAAPGRLFDLQIAAGLIGLPYPLGHGNLVNLVLGVQMPKGETLTEWRRRPLTPGQVRYAFDDVRYLLPLWKHISGQLEELGRGSWVEEEAQRLTLQVTPEEPAEGEKWRKLRGLGALDRRRLGIVRSLYYWREEHAVRTNRPTRVILRDDLLVEVARRSPTRERDLSVVRGLPRRDLDDILRVVAAAQSVPIESCPLPAEREQEPARVAWLTGILNAVLGDLCVRRRLAANLVASTQDVRTIVRSHLGLRAAPETSQLTQGWRGRHLLPDLLAILQGTRSLRIVDARAEAPFGYEDVSCPPAAREVDRPGDIANV